MIDDIQEDEYEIYLFDDNINTVSFVIETLSRVLEYPLELSTKLIGEIERKGKVHIETCGKEKAIEIRDLLISFGLKANICKSEV